VPQARTLSVLAGIGIEIRRLGAATILLAIVTPAELGALGRVNAQKANAHAVNFERVAAMMLAFPIPSDVKAIGRGVTASHTSPSAAAQ
jgi:hypothetical protein